MGVLQDMWFGGLSGVCCGSAVVVRTGVQVDGLFVALLAVFGCRSVAQYGLKSLCGWLLYFSECV